MEKRLKTHRNEYHEQDHEHDYRDGDFHPGRRMRGHMPPPQRGHHGPHRAKRGAIVHATLLVLSERPMHGYEVIAELEERSGGAWRPSPGSIYPALKRLAMKGFIDATEDSEGKRVFSLTEEGTERLAAMTEEHPPPWERFAEDGPSLRPLIQELTSQARQVGRFGSEEQRTKAITVLEKAKADLYALMAETSAE